MRKEKGTKLTKEIREEIVHLVETWSWESMRCLKTEVPTPLVPTGQRSPSAAYLNKYDPEYENRLDMCQETLTRIDAKPGGRVDWPAILAALRIAWNGAYGQALDDPDGYREKLEERDMFVKKLREVLRIARRAIPSGSNLSFNPFLLGANQCMGSVQNYLENDPWIRWQPDRPLRRSGRRPPKPWLAPAYKALRAAGVPAEEAENLLIALRLRNPRPDQ
jgi:hypothetical protein